MANAKVKPQEKDKLVIEEEIVVFQSTTEQISPSKTDKRKREEEIPAESPSKHKHVSYGNRSATTTMKEDSLSVPFWKHLNYKQSSGQFHTVEIGSFSLLTRADEKECFEDQRYLRGKCFSIFCFENKNDLMVYLILVYKYPLQALNVNFDLKVGESDFISEGQNKNIDAMLWWASKHKQDIFKNNQ
jgi:hypothetical protein